MCIQIIGSIDIYEYISASIGIGGGILFSLYLLQFIFVVITRSKRVTSFHYATPLFDSLITPPNN